MKDQKQSKDEMIQYILEQGKTENQAFFEKEAQKLADDFSEKMKQLESEQATRFQKQQKRMKESFDKKMQRIDLDENQAIMLAKQAYVEKIIADISSHLFALTTAQLQEMVCHIFMTNDLVGEVEVVVGEKSAAAITQAWLTEQTTTDTIYKLATEVLKNDGGFVLRQKGIEYNYLFSSILNQISEEKEYEIVSNLFENEVS
ncbi:hypothetical protein [Vagococcus silagei]|uniref:ATPase V n=1 Tax=Vagococcus silagei TaxID=2508885 RepID=A0A4S3B663_9ENTE|nr:hypothetical protein [Vagococcus silagei]THB62402.1 hypothetical protein ESZ54_00900 [Vagococcus silagei]